MINTFTKVLSHVNWRKKMLSYPALYISLILSIGAFSTYTIHQQNQSMTNIIQASQQKGVEKGRNSLISEQDTLIQQSYIINTIMIWVIAMGLLLGIIASLVTLYLATRPLCTVKNSTTNFASEDLNIELTDTETNKIRHTEKSISTTINNLHEIISEIHSASKLQSQHSSPIKKISTESIKLHDNIEVIEGDAQTAQAITDNVAKHLQQTTENVNTTRATTKKSTQKISNTVKKLPRFQIDMKNTETVTRKLSDAADQATSITDTIRDISSQTNLLALNAEIESARAGDQERGFAVVTDKIRQLAKHTEDATVKISTLVEEISSSVSTTVDALETSASDAKNSINKLTGLANETTVGRERMEEIRFSY